MYRKLLENKKELIKQYLSFNILFSSVDIILWDVFFGTLLFVLTEDFAVVAISWLIRLTALYIGLVFSSFLIDKFGYLYMLRASFLLYFLATLLFIPFLDNLVEYYIPLTLLAGVPRGIFWSTSNLIKLKDLHGVSRGRIINDTKSILLIVGIVFPILIGSLIEYTDTYLYVFVIAAGIYLFGLLYPWKYNKKPRSKIRSFEIVRILNRESFPKFAGVQIFNAAYSGMIISLVSALPFFFFESEFKVGGLISLTSFVAAIFVFIHRNDAIRNKLHFGYIGYTLFNLLNFLFALVWTPLFLVLRSIARSVGMPIGDVAYEDLDYRVREKILGDFKNESAVEMNMVVESLNIIGRMLGIGGMVLLLVGLGDDQELVVRVIFAIFAFSNVIKLFLMDRLNRSIKI